MRFPHKNSSRHGGVYIAVLGTAMIVSVLGMSALVLQRVQSRQLVAAGAIRQAQLNAESAVELALLMIKTEADWRSARTNGRWFTNRGTGAGTASADVIDPIDNTLVDNDVEPVLIRGIGNFGQAEQRVEVYLDPRKSPFGCLASAVAAGDLIDFQSSTLRSTGPITANQVSATASSIYGAVTAASFAGSTYYGTTSQVAANKLPQMPDWQTAFDYYRTNGTRILIGDLPSVTPNLGRNTGFETGTGDWSGSPPWTVLQNANISQNNNFYRSGGNSLRVKDRDQSYSGASQRIDGIVKPGVQYNVEIWIYQDKSLAQSFRLSLVTKGSGNSFPLVDAGSSVAVPIGVSNLNWTRLAATLTAGAWSGNLEYAFVHVGGADSSKEEFYLDDLVIRENTPGRFIYRQVLSPNVNPFGSGTTNPQGIYWIDCGNNRVVIERSRIHGTLLLINPGANSCVADGPIHWSPFVAGYPALLVDATNAADADFSIRATSRALNEKENGVNFNPAGSPHPDFGQDSDMNDIYRSEINGLIAVEDDLTIQNTPLLRGQIVVGDDLTSSGGALDLEFRPDSLLNPPPGFIAPVTYSRRPNSAVKAVLP